jgi:hypothetical protein
VGERVAERGDPPATGWRLQVVLARRPKSGDVRLEHDPVVDHPRARPLRPAEIAVELHVRVAGKESGHVVLANAERQ